MAVKILFFASLVDAVGCDEVTLEVQEGTTISSLLETLESAYPGLLAYRRCFRVAVNQEFSQHHEVVPEAAEIALIPPVSGGADGKIRVAVTEHPLDPSRVSQEVIRNHCGAVVTFLGTVRELTGEQRTEKLEYSAYQAMAEKELRKICEEAVARWSLGGAVVEHRVGTLAPGEIAVAVACSSPHRQGAFEAARFLIDTTKKRVPLWKKEFGPDGSAWIEGDARVSERSHPIK